MKAVLFDMDGVIIDSELYWRDVEEVFLKDLIPSWDMKDHKKILGLSVQGVHKVLADEYDLAMSAAKFKKLYNKVAMPIYSEKSHVIPGCRELMENLKAGGILMALASSSLRSWVDTAIKRHNIGPFFKSIISGEDIEGRSKPDPEIFLKSAERLGVHPKDCVVIEDSRNGTLAAKRAEMICIGFRNGFNEEQDLSQADIEITGFEGLNTEVMKQYYQKNVPGKR